MNKRIIPFLILGIIIILSLSISPLFAENGSCVYIIEADKSNAKPGDVINFTIYMQQTGKQNTMEGTLVIPKGLTFVDGSGVLKDNIKKTLGWDAVDWTTSPRLMLNGYGYISYTGTAKLALMTFSCVVDDDADNGEYSVDFVDLVADNEEYETKNPTAISAKINVESEKAISSCTYRIESDTMTAKPGDIVKFTVYMHQTDSIKSMKFSLDIPDGFTYVEKSGSVVKGLKSKLDWKKLSWEATPDMTFYGEGSKSYNGTEDVAIITFSCVVNDNVYTGDFQINLRDLKATNNDSETMNPICVPLNIHVESDNIVPTCTYIIESDKECANPGDIINFTVYMIQTGKQTTVKCNIDIPDVLTYVDGSGVLSSNIVSTLGWSDVIWNAVPDMLLKGYGSMAYEGTDKIPLMTFSCTVNSNATCGLFVVSCTDSIADDENFEPKKTYEVPAEITIETLETTSSCTYTIRSDKTSANPGDTITYSVYLQQTGRLNTMECTIAIPAGLTFVEGSCALSDNIDEILGWQSLDLILSPNIMINGIDSISFTGTEIVKIMTFQCTVDKNASVGNYSVEAIDLVADDDNYETKNPICIPAVIAVESTSENTLALLGALLLLLVTCIIIIFVFLQKRSKK